MQRRMGTAVLLAVGLIASTAQAAEYPERAIQLINPNSPGGGVGVYNVEINAVSKDGAWKITTGAGSEVMAMGIFSA